MCKVFLNITHLYHDWLSNAKKVTSRTTSLVARTNNSCIVLDVWETTENTINRILLNDVCQVYGFHRVQSISALFSF